MYDAYDRAITRVSPCTSDSSFGCSGCGWIALSVCACGLQHVVFHVTQLLVHSVKAVEFKKALGHERVGVLDMGAGSGLLSMMAAR